MKCPFRKITITNKGNIVDKTVEEFCECYGKECAYYQEWWSDNTKKYEPICGRVGIEMTKAVEE